ncbi:hypothetical protein [Tahibacter amnicola]|uniref:Uncharacterized protein n=1 Tax=Tahibacter amnicola TaxID=2976241 RepID=A0ABY6BGD7_9GAMM|nr:hypothetical protein [Tahibacter amnicola]UXI68368.1 hypothetical protein N4264_01570 [Tahibacter amnicola]
MIHSNTHAQLGRLIHGVADQAIRDGRRLTYDGGMLTAEDVVDIVLPSLLCLADDLARRLGFGAIGYRFEWADEPSPVFPLRAVQVQARAFVEVAPFVLETFERYLEDGHYDVTHLFAAAARTLRPDFDPAGITFADAPAGISGGRRAGDAEG